jgi:hypothetical protein
MYDLSDDERNFAEALRLIISAYLVWDSAGAYSSQLDCSAQLNRSFAISAMSKAPNPHISRSRLEFGR